MSIVGRLEILRRADLAKAAIPAGNDPRVVAHVLGLEWGNRKALTRCPAAQCRSNQALTRSAADTPNHQCGLHAGITIIIKSLRNLDSITRSGPADWLVDVSKVREFEQRPLSKLE
jgi:hypothetical protein